MDRHSLESSVQRPVVQCLTVGLAPVAFRLDRAYRTPHPRGCLSLHFCLCGALGREEPHGQDEERIYASSRRLCGRVWIVRAGPEVHCGQACAHLCGGETF